MKWEPRRGRRRRLLPCNLSPFDTIHLVCPHDQFPMPRSQNRLLLFYSPSSTLHRFCRIPISQLLVLSGVLQLELEEVVAQPEIGVFGDAFVGGGGVGGEEMGRRGGNERRRVEERS